MGDGLNYTNFVYPRSFVNGGAGGYVMGYTYKGGFGGGGVGNGGGEGGYGGGGAGNGSGGSGGGGGSYDITGIYDGSATNSGDGYLTIKIIMK